MLSRGVDASAQAGDISSIHVNGHGFTERYVVDAKHYRDTKVHMLIYGGNDGIVKWWRELQEEAASYNKRPLLIAKQNFQPVLVCMSEDEFGIFFGHWKDLSKSFIRAIIPTEDMVIVTFDVFLAHAKKP